MQCVHCKRYQFLLPGDHRKKSLIFGGNPILSIENSKCRRRLCIIHKNLLKEKSAEGACTCFVEILKITINKLTVSKPSI